MGRLDDKVAIVTGGSPISGFPPYAG